MEVKMKCTFRNPPKRACFDMHASFQLLICDECSLGLLTSLSFLFLSGIVLRAIKILKTWSASTGRISHLSHPFMEPISVAHYMMQ